MVVRPSAGRPKESSISLYHMGYLPALYTPDFQWNAVCGRWNSTDLKKVVPLSSELARNTFRHSVTQIGCRNSSSSQGLKILGSPKKIN